MEQKIEEPESDLVVFEKGDRRRPIALPRYQCCIGISLAQDNKEFNGAKTTPGDHVGLQVDFSRVPVISKVICIGQLIVADRPALLHICVAAKEKAYVQNPKHRVSELFWVGQKVCIVSDQGGTTHVVHKYQSTLIVKETTLEGLISDWAIKTKIKVEVDQLTKLAA